MPQDSVRVAFVGRLKNAALIEFMTEKGWSQSRLARELGVHFVTVSSWVLLKTAPVDEAILKKLEKLLGKLREDIFPDFFRSKEWRETRAQLPKEHIVVREIPVQKLLQSGRLMLTSPEVEYDKKELREQIAHVLKSLSSKEQKIIELRFGLGDEETHTLKEVGDVFGVHQERVRQIELNVLRKLSDPSISNRLRTFVEDK